MAALLFDTCCGCIELRTGCLIIGYLNLIYSVISVIAAFVVGLVWSNPEVQQSYKDALAKHPELNSAAVTGYISAVAVVMVVILLLFLIMNIVFVVGLHQNKRGHVKAYLIFNVIFLVVYAIMFFFNFAHSPVNWSNVIDMLLVILLSTYFLLVIRSHYYKMNDTSRQPAIYNTA